MTEVHLIEAETIDKVEGMMPTEDGAHIIAKLIVDGKRRHLAIPLVDAVPAALNLFAFDRVCRQIAADQNQEVAPMLMTVKDWDVILSEAGEPIINLTTQGPINLAYKFSPADLPELIAGLLRVAEFLRQTPPCGVTKQ
jgi:hypothetical protein